MPRRIRDLAAAAAVLCVLIGTLMWVNPRVREQVGSVTTSVSDRDWQASQGAVATGVLESVMSTTSGYAHENPYLVSLLIVAAVLFVLMVRT
jgi:hypothetical protein